MLCCERCFKDAEIKAIIKGGQKKGKCDFCYSEDIYVCELNNNEYLKDNFEQLIDVYTPIAVIGNEYPREKLDLLKNILHSHWNIFNLTTDGVYRFLI